MKRIIFFLFSSVIVLTACHKNEPIIPDVPNAAYVRVFTDFNTGGSNSNGYLYINGEFGASSSVALKSTAINDLDQYTIAPIHGDPKSTFFNDSYYSFGTIALTGYSNFFPSYYDRVKTAPDIGQFDFYKWAKVPQGALRLTFTSKLIGGGAAGLTAAGLFLDTTVQVQKDKPYTFLLTRNNTNTAYILLTINEDPASASLDANSSYVRFVNVSVNGQSVPDDLDVYLLVQRLDAPNPPASNFYSNGVTIVNNQLIGTVSGKFNTQAQFLKLPAIADSAFYKNNVLRLDLELPGFTFKFYPKGDSPASGNPPLFYLQSMYGPKMLDYAGIYKNYPFPEILNWNFSYPYVFDRLGAQHPTYSTIVFGFRAGKTLGFTRYLWEPSNASDGTRR